MIKKQTTIQQLANQFSIVLNDWLSPAQMDEINRRNATPEYGEDCCASHDFCDANMAMDEAFTTVCKRKINLQSDADLSKWATAWDIAKANNFKQAPATN